MADLGCGASLRALIDLPCGVAVRFLGGDRPAVADCCEILLKDQRRLKDYEDFARYVRAKSGARPGALLVWNGGGSWLRPALYASMMQIDVLYVFQSPRTDESMTDSRVVMMAQESDLCFMPNYKCAYSSMSQLYRRHFPSCAAADERISHALNRRVHMRDITSRFIFSFIRDPASRFRSFIVDKLCRGAKHHNYTTYRELYLGLLGMTTVDPIRILSFVAQVPHAFADPHWKSFHGNLFHRGRPLVDRVYDIASPAPFIRDLSAYLGREVTLPHALSSAAVKLGELREQLEAPMFAAAVRDAYRRDQELFEAVRAGGGAIDLDRRAG